MARGSSWKGCLFAGAGKDLLCEYVGQGGEELGLNRHRGEEHPVESGGDVTTLQTCHHNSGICIFAKDH